MSPLEFQLESELLTIPQAAKLLGCSVGKLASLKKRKAVPFVQDGRYVRFPRKALVQWIEGKLAASQQTA